MEGAAAAASGASVGVPFLDEEPLAAAALPWELEGAHATTSGRGAARTAAAGARANTGTSVSAAPADSVKRSVDVSGSVSSCSRRFEVCELQAATAAGADGAAQPGQLLRIHGQVAHGSD